MSDLRRCSGSIGAKVPAEKVFRRGARVRAADSTFHVAASPPFPSATPIDPFCFTAKMASLQRFVISVLLILSVTFVFFAQASEAAKGPKITHKVRVRACITGSSG